ncbi:hypothetical protein [Bacillus sp. Marseille-Q1617]|uniref:hypothetical protein n=1 Tax=Bacillus sp. Marseille-Q1617 TaxID=2736887 RepID=UPI00158DCF34|nr:hypothetical protein [Bacillus sp. Marseille-Q1617]
MVDRELPVILGGPILRRVDDRQAFIWIALSKPYGIQAEVCKITRNGPPAGFDYTDIKCSTEARTIKAGKHIYISLIKVSPGSGTFPVDTLLGYNLTFSSKKGETLDLGDFGLLTSSNPDSIVYGYLALPTFTINGGTKNKILYGSCRKLHGKGKDVFLKADQAIAADPAGGERPSSLFLMGDQIYADDVADSLILPIIGLGKELSGFDEELGSVEPGLTHPSFQKGLKQINGRQYISERFCKFTSRKASNHLFTMGEYMAMYLMSCSPELWRMPLAYRMFQPFHELAEEDQVYFAFKNKHSIEFKTEYRKIEERYQEQWLEVSSTVAAISAVRRVLANTPTYMIFDDHDITDDWNLSEEWKENVQGAPLGRHVISNGLASYWLFQGWGNDPDSFDHFGKTMQAYFDSFEPGSSVHIKWMNSLWDYDSWYFIAPTYPAAVFLDIRTQRGYDNVPKPVKLFSRIEEVPKSPNLIKESAWDKVIASFHATGWTGDEPLIMVSPTPLYGIGLIETFLQKYMLPLHTLGIPVQSSFDLEAWKYNGRGFNEFIQRVAGLKPSDFIILSGDLHSASAVKSDITFHDGKSSLTIHQLTSSPMKNVSYTGIWGSLMKFLMWVNARKRTNKPIYRDCDQDCNLFIGKHKKGMDPDHKWSESIQYQPLNDGSLIETGNNMGVFTYDTGEIGNLLKLS